MDPLTHLATGVICSQLLPAPSRWWAALAGAIFAVLPGRGLFFHLLGPPGLYPLSPGVYPLPGGRAPLGPGRGASGPGPGRPPLVQAPAHLGHRGPVVAPAPGPGHLLRHPVAQPLFPAAFFPGLDFYHRPLFYRPAAGRGHSRPGLSPLGAPGRGRSSGRGRGLSAGLRLLSPPGPGPGPPGFPGEPTPGDRPWPPCPNPFPAAAGN